ncbi:unnamed protein product [Staurois parvus]|uniref:Glucocorticoid receptor n=1 Tax=Staurois parvus TaxID=386267 RepID=A0ABN9B4F5_9NEOB|nr:unnamed protein product [Staurois parvus]
MAARSGTPIVVQDLCARSRSCDWPISDHMQSSKQDVTSDIIAYYL